MLRGDHNELYSALSNLVFNAVQYTPAGGRISIRWGRRVTVPYSRCATPASASRRSTSRA